MNRGTIQKIDNKDDVIIVDAYFKTSNMRRRKSNYNVKLQPANKWPIKESKNTKVGRITAEKNYKN